MNELWALFDKFEKKITMKLNLLLATSLLTGAAFGQFTQSNEPTLGSTTPMYVLDSNAVDYSSMTGTAQTWDYSTTPGISGALKTISVSTASSTAEASSYPNSDWAVDIPGFMTTYYKSTSSSRISQGFVFDGGSLAGIVKVVFDGGSDDAVIMNYPYAQGNTLTDAFAGNANTASFGALPTTGSVTTSVDGTGTLKLNSGTTITGVTRFKLSDHGEAVVPIPGFGNVLMDRTQYEYYDLANSTVPLLVHSTLVITIGGSPTTQHLVLSSEAPDEYLAVSKNNIATFGLYPNPATESVIIAGLSGSEMVSIVDMAGRTILSAQNTGTSQSFNVSNVQAGVYTVVVVSNGTTSTKKLTIN
jgi:hypothetical protein